MRCPKCWKFVGWIIPTINSGKEIIEVTWTCKTHWRVKINDWVYENFYPYSSFSS